MIRRITASFLAMLAAVVILVIVPLGLTLSSRERHDFAASAQVAARAAASVAEEQLDDRPGDRQPLTHVPVAAGDRMVILDAHGAPLLTVGPPVAPAIIDAVARHRRPRPDDLVAVSAAVGSPRHPDGTVILVRDAQPLDHRLDVLWAGLAAAALLTMTAGAVVAAGLARWITRPLRDLQGTAALIGHGDLTSRVETRSGPPEVRALAATIAEMARRIGSLLHSHRVMTADVSHQLRTPLSALRLRLELLVDEASPSLQPELQAALHETARLSRLTNGLLAVARAEALASRPQPVDVVAVVQQRADAWRAIIEEHDVTLTTQLGDVPYAWIVPGHLEQILDNLVANALDALDAVPAGGQLRLDVHPHGEQIRVRVRDNGPGMPPDRLATAFSRYTTGDSGSTGTGLGLAIVAQLVAADHGTCRLESTPGGGLTAILDLPAEPKRSHRFTSRRL